MNDRGDANPPMQRVFLGLERPPLLSAVQWLADNFAADTELGPTLDLSNVLVVLPTARSRHRLLQLLVAAGQEQSLMLQPPQIMTVGRLPEHLYIAEKPLASDLTQHIAWVRAIEETPTDELQPLLGEDQTDATADLQSLATVIAKLHVRLANDIWSFNSVHREVSADTGFLKVEAKRWEVLTGIQRRYYQVLAKVGLWDKHGARNYAAAGLLKANEIRCATDREIVLIGCADLNRSMTEMLRQVVEGEPPASLQKAKRAQVHALVAADDEMADRFDTFGSLISERWLDATLPLRDDQIQIVDKPADQAFAVAHFLGQLPTNEFAADEVTIGLPDETLAPQVERSLRSIGVNSRRLAGTPIGRTAPARLLSAIASYVADLRYDSLTALLRHPDLFDWLSNKVDDDSWLNALDVFQNNRLPERFTLSESLPFGDPKKVRANFDATDPTSKARAKRNADAATVLQNIYEHLVALLTPLTEPARPIGDWSATWQTVLVTIYGDRVFKEESVENQTTLAALETLYRALTQPDDVPDSFELQTTAVEALDWVFEAAAGERIVAPASDDAIELAGWLDLPLDDAPVLVVTNFNEQFVPMSEVGHQFLPNALCEQLKVQDNDRRYARDAYATHVITSVRQHVRFIVGRRDEAGEPARPSRLLFADSPNVAARRARAFFMYPGQDRVAKWLAPTTEPPASQQFTIPRPLDPPARTDLTVTSFREYMKCPYRFYLNKILRLDTISDDLRELDAGMFGDLCHNVLEGFANDSIKESRDAEAIAEFLSAELDRQAAQFNIEMSWPAVRIQIEQLRSRLRAFAPQQAAHRASGWQIVSTEELLEHEMDVDGEPFTIRGKIDRVDQHETTGQVAVWDYKTSEAGDDPVKKHYASRKDEWKDLQLPLYRHLVKEVKVVAGADFENLITGFVLLHGKLAEIRFAAAEWKPGTLESAEARFRDVVRQLRRAEFWPPTDPPPEYSEDLASICQDQVFEKHADAEEVSA